MLLAALAIGGAIGGLLKGSASANARQADYEDKVEELNRSKETLTTQYSQAGASDALARSQALLVAKENKAEFNLLADETLANRDMAITQKGKASSMESQINATQIATLAVENEKAMGAAGQQVATSGFRGTGTAGNVADEAKRAAAVSLAQAKAQNNLVNFQSYASAVSAYTSANQQIASYKRKVDAVDSDYQRNIASLDLRKAQTKELYDQQSGFLTEDIGYMEGEGYTAMKQASALDVLGGLFGGLFDGAKAAKAFE